MTELVSQFNPASYTIVTMSAPQPDTSECGASIERVMCPGDSLPSRLRSIWRFVQMPFLVRKISRLAQAKQVKVIVGIYPSLELFIIAKEVAKRNRIALVIYLHDTIAEMYENTLMDKYVRRQQKDAFSSASAIFVMSEGLVDLYRKKYHVRSQVLPHIYSELYCEPKQTGVALTQGFWAGAIYSINNASLKRVYDALTRCKMSLLLTRVSKETLDKIGISGSNVSSTFVEERAKYLDVISKQGVLILALNWPDETSVHEDELSTIFPTKTPEYLASGRPILVHCPENFYLAKFFKQNQCGAVVSERSVDALTRTLNELCSKMELVSTYQKNAKKALELFSSQHVSTTLKKVLEQAASSSGS